MNTSSALIHVSVTVPEYAIQTIQELARMLCNPKGSDETEDWVIAQPLPEEIRPGKLLRAARLRADMTQKELAEKISVPQTHISQYEKNKRKIPPQKAEALAVLLETSVEYFQ